MNFLISKTRLADQSFRIGTGYIHIYIYIYIYIYIVEYSSVGNIYNFAC
jgi:hypothetical protein